MKKRTKAIITIAIIFLFVVATVAVIVLFSDDENRKNTTLTSGLSSWTIESGISDDRSVLSSGEASASDTAATPEEQFVTKWSDACIKLESEDYCILEYEAVRYRFVLARLSDADATVAIDFTLDNEVCMSVIGAQDTDEISAVAQVLYAVMTDDFKNDTLQILVKEQNQVAVTIDGYTFTSVVSKRSDGTYSATMRLVKGKISEALN